MNLRSFVRESCHEELLVIETCIIIITELPAFDL